MSLSKALSLGAARIRGLLKVSPDEWRPLVWSWAYIFAILASYYVLRPVRDQVGAAGGLDNLPWLFSATLVAMLALNIPFAWAVKTLPRARFVPLTYRFFTLNILMFAAAFYFADEATSVWVGRVFYVWLSVFNLFVVSIFWTTIVDVFTNAQGKRLFGLIAAGATLGAISGSAVTALLAQKVPTSALLILAGILLELALLAMRQLVLTTPSLSHAPQAKDSSKVIGGSVWAGVTHLLSSPYLINIGIFMILFSVTSTFLYFEQINIAAKYFPDRGAQTAFFASVDLAVNVLTLCGQLFLTSRILNKIGVGPSLALLPAASVIGFLALALSPTIGMIMVMYTLRRAGNFAISRPIREILFTVIPREDRYKAKNVIDTTLYRLGDQVGAWTYAGVSSLGGVSPMLIAVPLSVAWLINSLWLGRRQDKLVVINQPVA
ncbi:NTP/NDP exchange transporter [Methylobacillus pratensis]|uniref:NTP/NDP exchange transporter n=1 Tax=Methylobacillus sp. Pita1 TaxID=3382642 RepID=UPI0038B4AE74